MNKRAYLRGIGAGMIVAAVVMGISSGSGRMSDAEILRRAEEIQNDKSVVLTEIDKKEDNQNEIIKEIPVNKDKDSDSDSQSQASVQTPADSKENNDSSTESSVTSPDEGSKAPSDGKPENNKSDEGTKESSDKDSDKEDNKSDNGSDNSTDKEVTSVDKEDDKQAEVKEPQKINPLPEGENGYVVEGETVELTIIRGDSSVSVSRRMMEAGLIESAAEFDKFLCANGYDKSISVGTYQIAYGLDFEEMAKIITRRR